MKTFHWRFSAALVLCIAVGANRGAAPVLGAIGIAQTPEQLCEAGTSAGASEDDPGYEEFLNRFRGRFKTGDEARWAWRVYKAVNRSGATVVVGRLSDTKSYLGKPGYCVLSNLSNWTVAINDVFIYGGTDRSAHFLLVSEAPAEMMNAGDRIDPNLVENERETQWRVIYNHEIHVLTGTKKYHLPNHFEPPLRLAASKPSHVAAKPGSAKSSGAKLELVLTLAGATVVTDIKAQSQKPGANDPSIVRHFQSGDTFGGSLQVRGKLPPGVTVTVWHPTPDNVLLTTSTAGTFTGVTQPKGFGAQTGIGAYVCTHFPTNCVAQANISIQWIP